MPNVLNELNYNITNLMDRLLTFFKGKPQDITFKYMDQNGNIKSFTVPNVAKVIQELRENGVTDAELAEKLKNYYSKIEVNNIRNAILNKFDKYYTKEELDNILKNKVDEINNRIDEVESEAKKLIDDTRKEAFNEALGSRLLSKAEYEANAEINRNLFTGSGVVKYGKHLEGLLRYKLKDLWNHTWEGCCDFRNYINDPDKWKHYTKAARVLHWSREGWLYSKEGSFKPVININGYLHKIYGINFDKRFETCINNVIELPDEQKVVPIVTNSYDAPELKQGDFIILKDLDREFVKDGTFDSGIDGWVLNADDRATLEWDSDNKKLKMTEKGDGTSPGARYVDAKLLNYVKYNLKFTVEGIKEGTELQVNANTNEGWANIKTLYKDGSYEVEFIYKKSNTNASVFEFLYLNGSDGDVLKFDDVSLRQAEEQPVVAISDVPAGDIYSRPDLYEGRKSVSRKILGFLESWEEDIAEKDFVFPYGNVQYQAGDVDELQGIATANFEGADTYSLFGEWQEPGSLIGKGYVWSKLSETDKVKSKFCVICAPPYSAEYQHWFSAGLSVIPMG